MLLRGIAGRHLDSRLMVGAVQFTSRSRRPSDVDSTAHDIRPPPLQR
jgi:hypothetical protein